MLNAQPQPDPKTSRPPALTTTHQTIRVAVVDADPLRFIGFSSLFEGERDLELEACCLKDLFSRPEFEVVLLSWRHGQNIFETMDSVKAASADVRIIVTGNGTQDETILRALSAGAKGYVEEASGPEEFLMALRTVFQGSVWAPRRVLSLLIERMAKSASNGFSPRHPRFTGREKQVLELLVAGSSNREVGKALAIEERTVKAHVAKLMRKVGVKNRIELTVHAITNNLLGA